MIMANNEPQPKLPTPLMKLLGISIPGVSAKSLLSDAVHMSCNLAQELDARDARIAVLEEDARVKGAAIVERGQEVTVLREKIHELEQRTQVDKVNRELAHLASERRKKLIRVSDELAGLAARFEGGASYEALCLAMRRIAHEAVTDVPGTTAAHVASANGQEKA